MTARTTVLGVCLALVPFAIPTLASGEAPLRSYQESFRVAFGESDEWHYPGFQNPEYVDAAWPTVRGGVAKACSQASPSEIGFAGWDSRYLYARFTYSAGAGHAGIQVNVRASGAFSGFIDGQWAFGGQGYFCTNRSTLSWELAGAPGGPGTHVVAVRIDGWQTQRFFDIEILAKPPRAPSAPQSFSLEQPASGTSVTLRWTPSADQGFPYASKSVIHRAPPGGTPVPIAETSADQRSFTTTEGLQPDFDYWVSAANAYLDGPLAGPLRSAPTPVCASTFCYKLRTTSKLGDLSGAATDAQDLPDATIHLGVERGRVYLNLTPGLYDSVPVVVARVTGAPAPETLDQTVGAASVDYARETDLCPSQDLCTFTLQPEGAQPRATTAGDVWNARLERYENGNLAGATPFLYARYWGP